MKRECRAKALIARSGRQINDFIMSRSAIEQMHKDNNVGKPLLNGVGVDKPFIFGSIVGTELVDNTETNELELWGEFIYALDVDEPDIIGEWSYEVRYDYEDMDVNNVMHKCELLSCTLLESLL